MTRWSFGPGNPKGGSFPTGPPVDAQHEDAPDETPSGTDSTEPLEPDGGSGAGGGRSLTAGPRVRPRVRAEQRSRHRRGEMPTAGAGTRAGRGEHPGERSKTPRVGRRASYREGASYQVLTFGSVALLALVSSIVNSRQYGIEVIGEYGLAMATVVVVRLVSTAKERPALVRELTMIDPRHPRVTGLFWATLAFSFTLTLVVGALALAVTQFLLNGPISRPALFVPIAANVAGYVFVGNTAENMDTILNGFRAARETFWARLSMAVSFLAISVGLAFVTGSVWGLILAQVGSMAVGLLHRLYLIHPFMRMTCSRQELRDGFRTLPDLLRFGLKITPGTLSDGASDESGNWLVAGLSSISELGAYSRGYTLVKTLMTLNVKMNAMLFPTLLERRANDDHHGFARALVDSLRYTTIALMLPAAALSGVSYGIMQLFGPGFTQGAGALALFLFVPSLAALSQIQRTALYSLDRAWLSSVSGLLRLIVTVAMGVVLTLKLGATGAALAMVIGYIVDVCFATHVVARNVTVSLRTLWPRRQGLAAAAGCAGGFIASRAVYDLLQFPIGMFAGAAVGSAVFLAVLVLGGAVNERDRERYKDARRLLVNRLHRAAPVP